MASVNQDFLTFQGDTVAPIFTVKDLNGAVVDISAAQQITWVARRNASTTAALTKTKTGGGISFTSSGTDGRFTVAITAADTAALDGWYQHIASVTDVVGNITTVAIGRMQVGMKPEWTYDPGLVGTVDLYTVRRLIGDVIQSDQKLADAEVLWAISIHSTVYAAAAECCRAIAAQLIRKVDISQGGMQTSYSQEAKGYEALAVRLEQDSIKRGGASAYVGGISVSDKQTVEQDSDRVQPQFTLGMFDNDVLGSVAHETLLSTGEGGEPT